MKRILFLSLLIALVCLLSCKSKKYDDLPAPLAELCRKIDKSPKNADLYQQRAEYYRANNKIDDALADILQAIKLDNTKSTYYVTLADVYLVKTETDLVEEMLKKAIDIDNYNEAYLKLAELYLYQYMYYECEETLETAIRLQNHNPKAYLTKAFLLKEKGDTVGYLRMMQLVIDQDPKEVIAYTALAEFFQKKLNPLAVSYYKNALEITPNDKILNYNLAKLYQDLGELELAKEQYNNMISIDPRSYPAYNNLGYIAFNYEDNYEEAVRYYSKAIEINPDYDQAWCNRGLAYEYMDEYEKAREDYLQCLKINPNYENAIRCLNHIDAVKK
ncbi:MAG: tetratricopeptide repeat protein [Bacteroidetes bacterium]|nr:tetratricopeptide repeat protein [Bacteroidota bacterium]